MPKRSSKKPRDISQLAANIVAEATGEARQIEESGKDPHAVALAVKVG